MTPAGIIVTGVSVLIVAAAFVGLAAMVIFL